MTQEEKQLLLTDLSARLPYGLYATVRDPEENDDFQPFEVLGIKEDLVWVRNTMIGVDHFDTIENIKPYLRPMSSMTVDEQRTYYDLTHQEDYDVWAKCLFDKMVDFCNENHLDYRGLIEKGLALEAYEDMYKEK